MNLFSKPDSFVAYLLKAKYFSDCSYMDSSLGNDPSYTWRSLRECRGLIRAGALKRVGSIWNDA